MLTIFFKYTQRYSAVKSGDQYGHSVLLFGNVEPKWHHHVMFLSSFPLTCDPKSKFTGNYSIGSRNYDKVSSSLIILKLKYLNFLFLPTFHSELFNNVPRITGAISFTFKLRPKLPNVLFFASLILSRDEDSLIKNEIDFRRNCSVSDVHFD